MFKLHFLGHITKVNELAKKDENKAMYYTDIWKEGN